MVSKELNLKHINVGQLVIEKELHDGKDEEWDTYILNEDKVSTFIFSKISLKIFFLSSCVMNLKIQ